jgi:glutathione peroxidase-family protein
MDAIKNERQAERNLLMKELIAKGGTGYINIKLPDKNGNTQELSELQGKVVLIDFSLYEAPENVDYTFALRDLYNKYHDRGFEIFQVSLDENRFLWEKAIQNIPWICVRDELGTNTPYVLSYNISTLPTSFLMDRQGNIIARDLDFKLLDNK